MFVYDINQKTPFSSISNNLLMIKLIKKYEVQSVRALFEKRVQVRESHLSNKGLIEKVARKYHQKRVQKGKHSIISMVD